MGAISSVFGYVLNFFYELLNNYGLAILIFSVLLRLILIPITIKQQKSMKKSAEVQEKMKDIQAKYKNNPEKLNQETINLYKTEKMSPFSGCLTGILQIIIILSVFWLVSQPLTYMKNLKDTEIYKEYKEKVDQDSGIRYKEIGIIDLAESEYKDIENQLQQENVENREELEKRKEEVNKLRINMQFLGLDLSKVPMQSLNDWRVYIIPVLYIITSFISIKITMNAQKKEKEKKNKDVIVQNEEKTKEDELTESMGQMNNTMLYMTPIMSISIAAIAPLGLALYWLVSNILMIFERLIINKIMSSKEEKDNE